MCSFRKILLIVLSVALIATCAWADSGKTVERDRLVAIAQDKGFVKVIVRFDVPNIKKLTAASTAYKAAAAGQADSRGAIQADAALTGKITSISGSVMSQLQLKSVSHKINHTYSTVPLLALDVSEQALDVLESSPDVLSITEDKLLSPTLNNTISIIGADDAWTAGYTGSGWYVAIIDTGILSSHEFFSGKAIEEACYSAELHCPNGQTEMTGTGAAAHHPNTYDGWDHGTHVSGIATGNNGSLFGVAKAADIIAVQVFSRFSGAAECGSGVNFCVKAWDSDIIAGLQYVYSVRDEKNIASVNMSLGGSTKYSDESTCDSDNVATKLAIDNLRSARIATIISSGNDGWCDGISAPACISSAIAVGATTDGDAEASFNNWHSDLMDLWAPGSAIYSSTGDTNSSYESWSGTSMSAPHVAGAWAILKQKDNDASVASLLSTVSSTGVSVTTACSDAGSKPRIQVDSALSAIGSSGPSSPSALSAASVSTSEINLSWTDNAANEVGFKIERKTGSSGTYSQITTVGQNVITYSDTGLTEATTYYYRVRAYNAGDSGYSNGAFATTQSSSSSVSGGGGGGGGGGGCFIATAAYGNPLHPYIKALREFRDKHLLTNSFGRAFVGFYYRHSPPFADVIRDSRSLKTVTRVTLTPVVMFVIYPYTLLTIFIALLMALLVVLRWIKRQPALNF